MRVRLVFLAVVAIWATTPLGIKWSAMDMGFIPAAAIRMTAAAAVCFLLCRVARIPVPWTAQALRSYSAGVVGLFGAMTLTYWSAQFIASGLISVFFGLTPILSGVFSVWLLSERFFSVGRLLALTVAVAGLGLVFQADLDLGENSLWGLAVLMPAVSLFSLSTVLIKKVNLNAHPLAQSCGTLILSSPLYLLVWWIAGVSWPAEPSWRGILAICYLTIFGSIFGFVGFFFVLKRLKPTEVGLINLLAPVFALALGTSINGERLAPVQWTGAAIVLLALAIYQWSKQPMESS